MEGLGQILHDRSAARKNIDFSDHARDDVKFLTILGKFLILIISNLNLVVMLVVDLIEDRVGTDVLHNAFETAIDREIVSRELQGRFLSWAEKGNIRRTNLGFDEKRFIVWNDIHNRLTRLDDTGVTRRRGDLRIAGPRLPEL